MVKAHVNKKSLQKYVKDLTSQSLVDIDKPDMSNLEARNINDSYSKAKGEDLKKAVEYFAKVAFCANETNNFAIEAKKLLTSNKEPVQKNVEAEKDKGLQPSDIQELKKLTASIWENAINSTSTIKEEADKKKEALNKLLKKRGVSEITRFNKQDFQFKIEEVSDAALRAMKNAKINWSKIGEE